MNRRDFMQTTGLSGLGLALEPGVAMAAQPSLRPTDKLRVGIIGTGLRGQNHLDLLLRRKDCRVTALCDIDPRMMKSAQALVKKLDATQEPAIILGDERDYRQLLEREDVDAVIIATPWRWHTEMAVAAMHARKYTGVEVCGATSVEECWEMVRAHEATGVPLFFLENVCYRRDVMAVLNMVRQGMFGEMMHLEGGYQHDLRGVKFNDGETPYNSGVKMGDEAYSEARWRTRHSVYRNGDLYPTHGVGPMAQFVDINRGNRFLHISSVATKSRGLSAYVAQHPKGGPNHPNARQHYRLGDVVTSILQTNNGETMMLSHDTNLPRPYSLGFRVQGTKGLWMAVNRSLYLEGKSPSHRWEEAAPYLEQYDHPLWQRHAEKAVGAGHGGMDWFLINAFVECAKQLAEPPFDVYDAATWMAITPLSEQSIASGGQPQAFPDFTRGRWMERQNNFARNDNY